MALDGGGDLIGPEMFAALADAPALAFGAAVGGGFGKITLAIAGRDRLGRVEDRHVMADGFVFGVALNDAGRLRSSG